MFMFRRVSFGMVRRVSFGMVRHVSFGMVLGLASFSLRFPYQLIVIYVLVSFWTGGTSIILHLCTPVPLAICVIGTEDTITFSDLLTLNIDPTWSKFYLRH